VPYLRDDAQFSEAFINIHDTNWGLMKRLLCWQDSPSDFQQSLAEWGDPIAAAMYMAVQRWHPEVTWMDPQDCTFPALLIGTHARLATDLRDTVFSLLNLVENPTLTLPKPNYTLSLGETFVHAAMYILGETQNLGLFACIDSSNARARDNTTPSWVPDWS